MDCKGVARNLRFGDFALHRLNDLYANGLHLFFSAGDFAWWLEVKLRLKNGLFCGFFRLACLPCWYV